ncbi:hypothetical protein BY996DRAFT_6603067 [Phakopsora pachyrhizi]|nr:hypothetical protein BY996DRAFT_6603067 [Phakopsora pachyrhizi]
MYPTEDLMQLRHSNFKQLTQTTHIAFGKLFKWPSKEEQKESSQLMQMEGFPNCIGCLDSYIFKQMHIWTNIKDYFKDGEYILADSVYASSDVVESTEVQNRNGYFKIRWNLFTNADETPDSHHKSTDGYTKCTIQMW